MPGILIKTLANYQALMGIQIIVVFDAHLVQGGLEREKSSMVCGYLFPEGETADSLIESFSIICPTVLLSPLPPRTGLSREWSGKGG